MSYPRSFVTKESDGSVKVDEVAMEAYKKEMKKWKVKNADEVILNYDMYVAESKSDWKHLQHYVPRASRNMVSMI